MKIFGILAVSFVILGISATAYGGGGGGEEDCEETPVPQPDEDCEDMGNTPSPTSPPTSALTSPPTSPPTLAPTSAPTSAPKSPPTSCSSPLLDNFLGGISYLLNTTLTALFSAVKQLLTTIFGAFLSIFTIFAPASATVSILQLLLALIKLPSKTLSPAVSAVFSLLGVDGSYFLKIIPSCVAKTKLNLLVVVKLLLKNLGGLKLQVPVSVLLQTILDYLVQYYAPTYCSS